MIVSMFSLFVARGAELPVIDPRLVTQPDAASVDTQVQGPAAQPGTTSDASASNLGSTVSGSTHGDV